MYEKRETGALDWRGNAVASCPYWTLAVQLLHIFALGNYGNRSLRCLFSLANREHED